MPVHPLPSVTPTVIGKVPVCVGVPLNTPAADNDKPVGKTPLFKLNVAPPIEPV